MMSPTAREVQDFVAVLPTRAVLPNRFPYDEPSELATALNSDS